MTRIADRLFLAIAFALLLCSVALTLVFGGRVDDPEYFNYVGRCLLSGRHLYSDIWDCKGPILYYVSAFGAFLHPVVGQTLLFAVILAIDLILFHGLIRRIGGTRAGISTFLFAALALGVGQYACIGWQEMLVCLFVLLGLWSQGRPVLWGDVLAGVCAGFVFLIKPNLISFLSVPPVQELPAAIRSGAWGRFALRCLCLVSGFAAVLLAVTACFLPDAVGDLWTGSLLWNLLQRSQNVPGWFAYWANALLRHRFWVQHGWILPIFWLLFAIGMLRVIVLRNGKWTCWAVWAVLETAAAFAFPGFCKHYVIVACLPVVLLAVGVGSGASVRGEWRFAALALFVFAMLLCVRGGWWLRGHIRATAGRERELVEISERIRARRGDVTVCGRSSPVAVLNKLGLFSRQRFPGLMFWWRKSSETFRQDIAKDLLMSLRADDGWLITEMPLDRLVRTLEDERIAAALSRYHLSYRAARNGVYLYRTEKHDRIRKELSNDSVR